MPAVLAAGIPECTTAAATAARARSVTAVGRKSNDVIAHPTIPRPEVPRDARHEHGNARRFSPAATLASSALTIRAGAPSPSLSGTPTWPRRWTRRPAASPFAWHRHAGARRTTAGSASPRAGSNLGLRCSGVVQGAFERPYSPTSGAATMPRGAGWPRSSGGRPALHRLCTARQQSARPCTTRGGPERRVAHLSLAQFPPRSCRCIRGVTPWWVRRHARRERLTVAPGGGARPGAAGLGKDGSRVRNERGGTP